MPIYKKDESGRFVPFEPKPFSDLEKEKVLEDWIENNPHLLLEGEDLAIVARQPRTGFDKYLDLLALDRTGATVVVELKGKGQARRDRSSRIQTGRPTRGGTRAIYCRPAAEPSTFSFWGSKRIRRACRAA